MAFCGKCGASIDDGVKFCSSCGAMNGDNSAPSVTHEATTSNSDDRTIVILARIIPILFFLPLLSNNKTQYGIFHANQGLLHVLFSFSISIVAVIPILGWILSICGAIASFIFWIIGILSAVNGEMKELPFIGKIQIIK